MEKCKTCVYWKPYVGKGVCTAIDHIPAIAAYVEVRVQDDSGLDVCFHTSPEFGCSLHKAKES